MFINILSIENTKNLKRSLLWVELIILALIVILIIGFLYSTIHIDTPEGVTITEDDLHSIPQLVTWPGVLPFTLRSTAGSSIGVLLLVIFVGAVTTQEYTWRTYRLWLSRGIPRPLLVIAKFTALLIPILALVLTALISGAAISAVFSQEINGSLYLDQVDFWQLGLSVLRTAYVLLPYTGLTFLLAIATRSAVITVGGGLAFVIFIESFLLQMLVMVKGNLSRMANFLPVTLSESLLNLNQAIVRTANSPSTSAGDTWTTVLGIGAWTLLFLGVSIWIFQKQDISE
jgi:ABC-type transport system involved in multi-copper enzyme maturation permease subunit